MLTEEGTANAKDLRQDLNSGFRHLGKKMLVEYDMKVDTDLT